MTYTVLHAQDTCLSELLNGRIEFIRANLGNIKHGEFFNEKPVFIFYYFPYCVHIIRIPSHDLVNGIRTGIFIGIGVVIGMELGKRREERKQRETENNTKSNNR
jgi:hypothetical protein